MSDLRRSIIFPDENQGNLIGPSSCDRAGRPGFANAARILVSDGEPCRRCGLGDDANEPLTAACFDAPLEDSCAITLARCSATSSINPKRPS
jgi:hypothetical protein